MQEINITDWLTPLGEYKSNVINHLSNHIVGKEIELYEMIDEQYEFIDNFMVGSVDMVNNEIIFTSNNISFILRKTDLIKIKDDSLTAKDINAPFYHGKYKFVKNKNTNEDILVSLAQSRMIEYFTIL
jgi:hypothetical protein